MAKRQKPVLDSSTHIIRFQPFGVFRDVFTMRDPEIVLGGAAGTGKSRAALELLHLRLAKYPGSRAIMIRKTRKSMSETCMITYERKVLHDADQVRWSSQDQKYYYPNGSELVVCGMDKSSKVLSSEYDFAYANECTELALADWETVLSRLRNGVTPYQQIMGDCNPDAPTHWIVARARESKLRLVETRHEDNPVFYNHRKREWTEAGKSYVYGTLESLTGVRYKRLRLGQWAGAEGAVYEEFDREKHLVKWFKPPEHWETIWTIDFGYVDPFVWQEWAFDPNRKNMFLCREIYQTQRTVADHMQRILSVTKADLYPRNRPLAIICDHDAEDRATVEQFLRDRGVNMLTLPAYKKISPGINRVKERLRNAKNDGDSKSNAIFFMEDSLIDKDPALDQLKLPICTVQEFDAYTWNTSATGKKASLPIDKYNHGMDDMRYAVGFVDDLAIDLQQAQSVVYYGDDVRVQVSPY